MKTVISCLTCLVLLCCGFSFAYAARSGGKASESYKTVNDDKFNMLFDGTELSVVSKGDKLMQFVCMVSGKFPSIQYNGDYAVTGPRNPNYPDREKVIVKRINGHNSIVLKQQEKIMAETQKRGLNPNSPPADLVAQYTSTYDAQSSIIPKDLEHLDKIVRPSIDNACVNFVNYAIPRLKNSGSY